LKKKVISSYSRKNPNFYKKVRNDLDGSYPICGRWTSLELNRTHWAI
jgi:hypothetical protein